MHQIDPKDLQNRLLAGERILLLDVRELWERNLCSLPDSLHTPMQQVPAAIDRLDRDQEVVVYCHSGVRSFNVGRFLEHNGFKKVVNLRGGIDAWAKQVDPAMPRY